MQSITHKPGRYSISINRKKRKKEKPQVQRHKEQRKKERIE
jgi:hypothetical protein